MRPAQAWLLIPLLVVAAGVGAADDDSSWDECSPPTFGVGGPVSAEAGERRCQRTTFGGAFLESKRGFFVAVHAPAATVVVEAVTTEAQGHRSGCTLLPDGWTRCVASPTTDRSEERSLRGGAEVSGRRAGAEIGTFEYQQDEPTPTRCYWGGYVSADTPLFGSGYGTDLWNCSGVHRVDERVLP